MFSRRINILLGVLLLIGLALLVRLAQIQIGWHDRFRKEDYTHAAGSHLVETVRGGIYGHWGTPLAVEAPSFDLAVHYSQLLMASSAPWRYAQVQELMDEYVRAAGLEAPSAAEPLSADDADAHYRALWEERLAASTPNGSMDVYLRRRLAGDSRRDIGRSPPDPRIAADWRAAVARLTGASVEDLTASADEIIERVERIESRVRALQQEREGRSDIRVAEKYQWHCVLKGVPAEAAAVFRTEPESFPAVRSGRELVPAIQVFERSRRHYPNGALAPHIVGEVSAISPTTWDSLVEQNATWTMADPLTEAGSRYEMDDSIGRAGVEKACERLLRGSRGYVLNHLLFGVLKVDKEALEVPPTSGRDVYLTIREDFQAAANAALERAAHDPRLDFKKGALVIVDVRDGSVLAASSYPSYDLTSYRQDIKRLAADPRDPLVFRPLQGALSPGSVFKVITTVAALEEGAITESTEFTCERSQVFLGRVFHCTGRHGTVSLLPAFEHSCNVYFYNVGARVGGEALARWARQFGLGALTGVDLPYERAGRVLDPKSPFGVLNLAIGQEQIVCSPLQVANMVAAVANGGKLYRPHFFDYARNPDGDVVGRYEPQFVQVPVKQSTLNVLRECMRLVVESGTAQGAGLARFRAAGKTGTAEVGVPGLSHAWFAGYAPCDNPKVAFAVVSEATTAHGATGAAPIMASALEPIWPAIEQMP